MIAYFIGTDFKQKAVATSTGDYARITDDTIRQSVDGVASCELVVSYSDKADDLGNIGEFIYIPAELSQDASFFQIISKEVDYIEKTIRYYADTNFIWFASQVANDGQYGRVSQVGRTVAWYLDEFVNSNAAMQFTIGTNEMSGRLAIGDTNASTAKEAIEKTAALFNAEISFAYQFDGNNITPYINICEKDSGDDTSETLTVGTDITELIETVDCSEIATAVKIRGIVKSDKDYSTVSDMAADDELLVGSICIAAGSAFKIFNYQSVSSTALMTDYETAYNYNSSIYIVQRGSGTLRVYGGATTSNGYAVNLTRLNGATVDNDKNVITPLPSYDSGDYFVSSEKLFCRSAWYKYGHDSGGKRDAARFAMDIFMQGDDVETTDPQQILDAGIALLEQHKEPVYSYSCKCNKQVIIGEQYTMIVPDEHLYVSVRCLETEKSETRGEFLPTFGNYIRTKNAFEIMARNAK